MPVILRVASVVPVLNAGTVERLSLAVASAMPKLQVKAQPRTDVGVKAVGEAV